MADTATAPAPPSNPVLANLANSLKLSDPSKWAADPAYENSVNNINSQLAGLQSNSDLQTQRVNEDDITNTKSLADTNQQSQDALQNRLANQGIGYSGINVKAVGDQDTKYLNAVNQLATNKKRTLEDIARDTSIKQGDLQGQLSQAQIDRANRESEREKQQAADEAAAQASKAAADTQRQWLSDLTAKLTASVQPQATPTGQMSVPNTNPKAVIQQALQQAPPPAIKPNINQIKSVQDELRNQGFDPGTSDGFIGPKTLQAYNRWRSNLNMPPVNQFTMDDVTLLANTPSVASSLTGLGGTIHARGGQQA